ncbi:MAG TPA: hypothetical protein VH760_02120 [Gaiellaceae bacterium]|jgi:hypothetical protein
MTARPIVLVHVPRTAGTALASIMRHHYRGGAFRGGGNAFARPELIEARLRDIAASSRVKAVAGHLTFGLADLLPSDARFIAILREPVERTLSHFHVLPRSRSDRVPAPGKQRTGLVPPWQPSVTSALTIEEAVAPGGPILDNLQTRMLCGTRSPFDALPADAVERAKRNLTERFTYVGTTERFDELVAMLNLGLGWPSMALKRSRAYAGRPARAEVSPSALQLIEERNVLDRELHEHAAALFGDAVEAAGAEFQAELAVVREATRRRLDDEAVRPEELRSLSQDARVALALAETALARTEVRVRKLTKELARQTVPSSAL